MSNSSKSSSSVDILSEAFSRKKKMSPLYTKSALARDLGVSSAFISNIFKGSKEIPSSKLDRLIYLLEMDDSTKQSFLKLRLIEKEKNVTTENLIKSGFSNSSNERDLIPLAKGSDLLKKWWYIVVLESLATINEKNNVDQTRLSLNLSSLQWNEAVAVLLREELIEQGEYYYQKKKDNIYIPNARSKNEIRLFHEQMIDKSKNELLKQELSDYERRLISGFTFSLNSKQVDTLKVKIYDFLSEITSSSSDEEIDEVYQLNVQLFPHSGRKLDK